MSVSDTLLAAMIERGHPRGYAGIEDDLLVAVQDYREHIEWCRGRPGYLRSREDAQKHLRHLEDIRDTLYLWRQDLTQHGRAPLPEWWETPIPKA